MSSGSSRCHALAVLSWILTGFVAGTLATLILPVNAPGDVWGGAALGAGTAMAAALVGLLISGRVDELGPTSTSLILAAVVLSAFSARLLLHERRKANARVLDQSGHEGECGRDARSRLGPGATSSREGMRSP